MDVAEKNSIPVTVIPPAPAPVKEKISKIAQKVLDDLDKYPFSEWKLRAESLCQQTFDNCNVSYILIYRATYYGCISSYEFNIAGLNLKKVDIKAITEKINLQRSEAARKEREKECAETLEKMGLKLEDVKDELAYIWANPFICPNKLVTFWKVIDLVMIDLGKFGSMSSLIPSSLVKLGWISSI